MMPSYILHSWASCISVALLLGVGLAMDVFGVSITDGFKYKKLTLKSILWIAIVFGVFQGLFTLIGWAIVYGISSIQSFSYIFSQIVPPLAFVILAYIGIKMIIDGKKENEDKEYKAKSFVGIIILQAIATSIDALSSGLAMNSYSFAEAGVSIVIIALMSFIFALAGIYIGKKFGTKAGNKAAIIGGVILIIVGAFILIKGEIRVNAPQIIPSWLEWLF